MAKINSMIKKIETSEINLKIILLFLEKLEKLTQPEREEILKVIQFLNCPILVGKYKKIL